MRSLHQLSARDGLSAVHERTISPADLVEASVGRIIARDFELEAFEYFDPLSVIRQPNNALDQPGLLEGLPVGIKDLFDTSDMPTTYGSAIYARHQPVADAAAVAMLRELGAVVVGKTVSTEFATWVPPKTRNPHRPERTPGGSSSGSAAAVADHMVPVALGTQTLGSVIRPASFCGVVGFKPSYGRISTAGVKPLAESLDTIGVFARDVPDAELIYRALSGDESTAFSPSFVPRILICRGFDWDAADDDAKTAFEEFVDRLRGVVPVQNWEWPESFCRLNETARVIHDYEMYRGLTYERTRVPEKVSKSLMAGFEAASRRSSLDYEKAKIFGFESRHVFAFDVDPASVLITLSAPGEAPMHAAGTGSPIMNCAWTLLHAPCVSIPVLTGKTGMPIGLQVVAPAFRDADALQAAEWLLEFSRSG